MKKSLLKSFDLCLILFSTGFMKSVAPYIEQVYTFLVFILQRLMVAFFHIPPLRYFNYPKNKGVKGKKK